MELAVDSAHLGTSERSWAASGALGSLSPLGPIAARRIVLVAPHPDDEVFGAAGLVQHAVAAGISLHFVAVTDGEASHPLSSTATAMNLADVRSRESELGLSRLGVDAPRITRLRLPDGGVRSRASTLQQFLEETLEPDDLCVAPWRHDGHPDHDVCGNASEKASDARGARVLSYLVWAWHWADAEGQDIPWQHCRRLNLTRRQAARKRWATHAFRSQIRTLGPDPEDVAVMPGSIMRRFWRNFEIYIDERRD